MDELTPAGRDVVADLQQRYGVGYDAVLTLLRAVAAGGGSMAQFNHSELGGMGQWSQGGMTMVGDMFNNGLKARVDGLCSELSRRLGEQPLFAAPPAMPTHGYQSQSQGRGGSFSFGGGFAHWWPGDLGQPAATGAQNNMRYAWFPGTRRLAVQAGGRTMVYDTGEHSIGGFAQQQSGDGSITLTSQFGTVRLSSLPVVSDGDLPEAERELAAEPAPAPPATTPGPMSTVEPEISTSVPAADGEASPRMPAGEPPAFGLNHGGGDIIGQIERLRKLRDSGVLSDQEFATAKGQLLKRL